MNKIFTVKRDIELEDLFDFFESDKTYLVDQHNTLEIFKNDIDEDVILLFSRSYSADNWAPAVGNKPEIFGYYVKSNKEIFFARWEERNKYTDHTNETTHLKEIAGIGVARITSLTKFWADVDIAVKNMAADLAMLDAEKHQDDGLGMTESIAKRDAFYSFLEFDTFPSKVSTRNFHNVSMVAREDFIEALKGNTISNILAGYLMSSAFKVAVKNAYWHIATKAEFEKLQAEASPKLVGRKELCRVLRELKVDTVTVLIKIGEEEFWARAPKTAVDPRDGYFYEHRIISAKERSHVEAMAKRHRERLCVDHIMAVKSYNKIIWRRNECNG